MKKFVLFVLLIALCCSCDKYDSEQQPSIIGEWQATNWIIIEMVDGKITGERIFDREEFIDVSYIFKQDNTGFVLSDLGMDGKSNMQKIESFTWLLSDDKLVFTDVEYIYPPGIDFDRVRYPKTNWTVHKLESKKLMISYTQFVSDIPNEQLHNIFTFKK